MSNVINFDDLKKNKLNINNIEEYDFDKEKEEFLSIINKGEWELVARNHIDASAMAKIILENDPNVSHVEIILCISRKNEYFKVNPVLRTSKEIRLCSSTLGPAYLQYLHDNNMIVINSDGSIEFKDKE